MGFNYKSWAIRMQWHPWNFIARHELSQSNGDTIKIYEVFIALTMGFALGFHENCMGTHASDVISLQPNSSTSVQHQLTHQPWPSLSAACFWAWCWHWWSCMWRWGRWTWSSWSTWMSWPSSSLSSKWGHGGDDGDSGDEDHEASARRLGDMFLSTSEDEEFLEDQHTPDLDNDQLERRSMYRNNRASRLDSRLEGNEMNISNDWCNPEKNSGARGGWLIRGALVYY